MARLDKTAPITALFDYDSLETQQRSIVQQRTGEIRERLRRSAQDVWEIGQKLSDVRSRLQYGQFLSWIKAEFGWSQRTAYNFINVYETFGDRFANLAKVNIATSLLYQLASPSVPEELRDQILRAAEQGETMTAKELQATIQTRRLKATAVRKKQQAEKEQTPKQAKEQPVERMVDGSEIITVIARSADDIPLPDSTLSLTHPPLAKAAKPAAPELTGQPGWYQLAGQHLVFCGDTAAQAFASWAPAAKLAIAITANDWAHDWLIDQADNVVVLPTAEYSDDKLKQLLTLLSSPGDTVIFPWLPDPKILATAHALGRMVYAGEANVVKCERAIAASKLRVTPIEPTYVAELVG